jgi:hypothetical protein
MAHSEAASYHIPRAAGRRSRALPQSSRRGRPSIHQSRNASGEIGGGTSSTGSSLITDQMKQPAAMASTAWKPDGAGQKHQPNHSRPHPYIGHILDTGWN